MEVKKFFVIAQFCISNVFFFPGGSGGDGFVHARQMLYHWATFSNVSLLMSISRKQGKSLYVITFMVTAKFSTRFEKWNAC